MTRMATPLLFIFITAAAFAGSIAMAQTVLAPADPMEARRALVQARQEGEDARRRAEKLEAAARLVTKQVDRAARETAAVAARIQETEAEIAGRRAQIRLISDQRELLRGRLAERQVPLVRLSGALQRLSRRPPVLGLLRPGSLRDTVYLRALLDTMLPEVQARTAALRSEIKKARALESQQAQATRNLEASKAKLGQRQKQLAALESQARLASREATGIAARESERALALAEKAGDLSTLLKVVGEQGKLRASLAALPGPILRPLSPESSQVIEAQHFDAPPRGLTTYILPVTGRLVAGYGEEVDGRPPSRGIMLATQGAAQAVAPAAGRVAFADRYRGYGQIVILEHASGWTSLVTGLARLNVEVGDQLVAGSPLGAMAPAGGVVTLELRQNGEAVNPLQYLRSL